MILELDSTFRILENIFYLVEFTFGNPFLPIFGTGIDINNFFTVEPMLNLRSPHNNSGAVELAGRLDSFLFIGCAQAVDGTRAVFGFNRPANIVE